MGFVVVMVAAVVVVMSTISGVFVVGVADVEVEDEKRGDEEGGDDNVGGSTSRVDDKCCNGCCEGKMRLIFWFVINAFELVLLLFCINMLLLAASGAKCSETTSVPGATGVCDMVTSCCAKEEEEDEDKASFSRSENDGTINLVLSIFDRIDFI